MPNIYDCERNNEFHIGQKVLDYKRRERVIKDVLTGTAKGLYLLDGGELVSICQIETIKESEE